MSITPTESTAAYDKTGAAWKAIVETNLVHAAHVIALRGAGSFNGISTRDANEIIAEHLVPRIEQYISDGKVCLIYDGDNDDPQYPDIGYIMGRLCDYFGARIECIAVQMESWFRYQNLLPTVAHLHSANDTGYQTIVFPDKTFPGNHDYFSQSERLCKLPQYEQWYVGACGEIATKQLADYSVKAADSPGPHKAVIFRAPVSADQETKIREKIEKSTDPEKISRLKSALERRIANPYGLLCTQNGEFILRPEYGNLEIEVI
ncbi:MAG TPA: hypothetical protein VFT82_00650 [Candidatus Paceibacterota bacterium]|nr:hypothetical protein [Candidatus Paceibacterota bacterium]